MKPLRCLITVLIFWVSLGLATARLLQPWSYQELLDKSDLVVIATPTATKETKERINLPGFVGQPVIGVETQFAVSAVLKGGKVKNELTLHHYKAEQLVPNGPLLVSFAPDQKQPFLLFLVREPDGRYAPTFGQKDPAFCGINSLQPTTK